jgi:hypothetical protein
MIISGGVPMTTKAVDYKKTYKELYGAKALPGVVKVPPIRFAMAQGEGDPNEEAFSQLTAALYSFSYAVKMSYKSDHVPEGYYEYKVFPLEGVWDLVDPEKGNKDKKNYKYTLMIRQPDFLTPDLFGRFMDETRKKKPNDMLDRIYLEETEEGLCCQMLHVGPYDNEPVTFEKMMDFCRDAGYERISMVHREIYLSDPRKSAPEKLKTILRFQIK